MQSLILVAIVAAAVAAGTTMSYFQNQQVQTFTEKVTILDLESFYSASLMDGTGCTAMFDGTTLDVAQILTPGYSISYNSVPASSDPNGPKLMTVGEMADKEMSRTLEIQSITVTNFERVPPQPPVGAVPPDYFQAQLQVGFNPAKMFLARQPAKVKLLFKVDLATGNVSNCQGYIGSAPVPPTCYWVQGSQSVEVCQRGYYARGVATNVQSISRWGLWPWGGLECCPVF